jgi:hypothetical protein
MTTNCGNKRASGRRTRRILALGICGASALAMATVAEAAPPTGTLVGQTVLAATPRPRTQTLGAPYKSGSYVKAYVHTNSGTSRENVKVQLQRRVGLGVWVPVDKVEFSSGEHVTTLQWSCAGRGTHTYRLRAFWERDKEVNGPQHRFRC